MIIAIIQARMGSTRLPGKVLKEVEGMTLLEYQLSRIKKSKLLDKVIIATSILPQDDPIVNLGKEVGVECFRGSENDVLTRYYAAAKSTFADIVVRLTADCPFSDPDIIDDTIRLFMDEKADYAANTVPPQTSTYPNGSDVEVFSMKALDRANTEAKDPHDREHVTFYFWKYDKGFKTVQLKNQKDLSKYRFTVDYPEDLEVVSFIIKKLKEQKRFGHISDVINIIDSNPEIKEKNSKLMQCSFLA
jgi:spore coat polysaccharide biosynthesis protein SpsF